MSASQMAFKGQTIAGLLILGCLLATVAYLSPQGKLSQLNRLIQDFTIGAKHRPLHDDVIIVAIDNPSIEAFGRWPWRRALHAELLDRIGEGKPKAIGLDILFSEVDQNHLLDDTLLAASIKRNQPVILPMFIQGAGGIARLILPQSSIIQNSKKLGHAHVNVDDDGIVRTIDSRIEANGKIWQQFALAVQAAGTQASTAASDRNIPTDSNQKADRQMVIPYAGGAGYFPRVSYLDVIRGAVAPDIFTGKYVLIGVTAEGIADKYATPTSGTSHLMPGVEILANIVDGAQRGLLINIASPYQNMAFNLTCVLFALAGFMLLRPFTALCVTLLLGFGLFSVTYLFLSRWGFMFNPAAGILGLVTLYILWSWHRLDTATRYLAAEIESFQQQKLSPFTAKRPPFIKDFLSRRIAAVDNASQQFRLMHQFVSDAVDTIPYPTLIAGKDGVITIANAAAARHLDSTPTALIGKPIRALTIGIVSTATEQAVFPDEKIFELSAEIQAEARDERGRDLIVNCVPIFNMDQTHSGWILSIVDISELREAERAREEAFRFIAHDMRAPLSIIISILETRRMEPAADHALLDKIDHYVSDALSLADDVVNLSRAKSGDYHLELLNVGDLLTEAANESWNIANANNINIQLLSIDDSAYLMLDRNMFKRTLSNLLSNAIKFSPSGSSILCSITRDHGNWDIAIKDNGPGISSESYEILFRPFTRLHTQSHPEVGGTGLGLAFVHAVVTRLGGRISVQSAIGVGSTFHVVFPDNGNNHP